jgi:hypothetical protein
MFDIDELPKVILLLFVVLFTRLLEIVPFFKQKD